MKWIFRHALIVFIISSCATQAFAQSIRVISGLDAASRYQGKANGQLFIRTGSFTHESNAVAYEKLIRSRISYPVKMSFSHGYYVVTIGPVANAAEVRSTASKIMQGRKRDKQTFVKTTTKSSKSAKQAKSKQTKHVKPAPATASKQTKSTVPAAPVNVPVHRSNEPVTAKPIIIPEPAPAPKPKPVLPAQKPATTKPAAPSATETLMSTFSSMLPGEKSGPEPVDMPANSAAPPADVMNVKPVSATKSQRVAKPDHKVKSIKTIKPVVTKMPTHPVETLNSPTPIVHDTASYTKPVMPPSTPLLSNDEFSRANWIVSVGGGEQFPTFNSNMTVNNNSGFPAPFDVDVYATEKQNQSLFSAYAGRRWLRDNQWFPAITLAVNYEYILGNDTGSTITQYSDPEFLNYDYSWNVSSNVLMALLKVNVFEYSKLSPYIAAGLGGAYNHTNNYKETARANVTPRTSPAFSENSSLQFAYTLKAGIDWEVAHQVIASVEYQYLDIGNMSSGHGDGPWSNSSLNLGSYRSNAVLVNVGYYFGS